MESPRFFLESPIILPHGYALPAVPYCPLACISIELPCSSCYCFRLSVISSVSFSTSGSSISKSSAICTGDQPFANFLATKFFNVAIRPCFSPSFSPFSRPSFNPSSRPSFRPSSYSALRSVSAPSPRHTQKYSSRWPPSIFPKKVRQYSLMDAFVYRPFCRCV